MLFPTQSVLTWLPVHKAQTTFSPPLSAACIRARLDLLGSLPPKAKRELVRVGSSGRDSGLDWGIESEDPGSVRILGLRCTQKKTLQSPQHLWLSQVQQASVEDPLQDQTLRTARGDSLIPSSANAADP